MKHPLSVHCHSAVISAGEELVRVVACLDPDHTLPDMHLKVVGPVSRDLEIICSGRHLHARQPGGSAIH